MDRLSPLSSLTTGKPWRDEVAEPSELRKGNQGSRDEQLGGVSPVPTLSLCLCCLRLVSTCTYPICGDNGGGPRLSLCRMSHPEVTQAR